MNVVSAVKILAVSVGAAVVLTPIASELGLCCSGPSVAYHDTSDSMPSNSRPAQPQDWHEHRDLHDILADAGFFDRFLKLVDEAGLTEQLRAGGQITVFAPTDHALAEIEVDKGNVFMLVQSHIVRGSLWLDETTDGTQHTSLSGQSLQLAIDADGHWSVAGAAVQARDVPASNGVIHVIDQVFQTP